MTRMDDDLIESWRSSLPSYFNDTDLPLSQEYLLAHAIGRWRLRIMRIIMYRPFFLRWVQSGVQPLQLSIPEDNATSRCLATAESCIAIISRFWATATHTRLAAWYVLYFLLQAVLIPVHCLRHVSSHSRLAEWIEQVNIALEIVNAMVDINPNALKCKDIIYKLCGTHLVGQEAAQKQQGLFEEVTSGLPYVNPGDSSSSAWMTELDTAINHYDMSCGHLTNVSGADYREANQTYADSEAFNLSSFGPGSVAYDFDLGLMLMQ